MYVDPTKEAFAQFKDLPTDAPVHMLNLLRFREKAIYPDGRDVTGAEAYKTYGRESAPVFQRLGGRQIWIGKPRLMLIGPEAERWDLAFIAAYPSGQAFIDMVRDPDYRLAVVHRTAAVEDSRLLRLSPLAAGERFGETASES